MYVDEFYEKQCSDKDILQFYNIPAFSYLKGRSSTSKEREKYEQHVT